jgi:DNA repair exonuclease SbcCD nuclease subunit
MIWVTGDTHIPLDIKKLNTNNFPEQKMMTKNDYLIICGDFGGVWYSQDCKDFKSDLYWQKWLRDKTFTTLFVDGNHENHQLLTKLPQENKFGGIVGKVIDGVYHLKRGEIYTIEDKTFFCFGGASSHDKEHRIEGISWWREELPTMSEMNNGLDNLDKFDNKVNYIISHCCSSKIQSEISKYYETDCLTKYFDEIENKVKFDKWFFGHYHEDREIDDKHLCIYNNKIML